MHRPDIHISNILLSILVTCLFLPDWQAQAGSVIRITGDKSPDTQSVTGAPKAVEPISPPRTGTIRIIGNRPTPPQPQNQQGLASKKTELPEAPVQGIKDKSIQAPDQVAEQPVTRTEAEEEALLLEIGEQQLAQRLAAIKEKEAQRLAEKAEQERADKAKFEKEKADRAALHAETKRQQQLLEERRIEEEKKRSEKIDAERRAAELKAEEERREARIRSEQELLARKKTEEEQRLAEIRAEKELSAKKTEEERISATSKTAAPVTTGGEDKKLYTPPVLPGFTVRAAQDSPSPPHTATEPKSAVADETIWELYLSAKANDPVLGRAEARVASSRAESDIIKSALMPHLNSNAGVKHISQTLTNYSANEVTNDYTALNYNLTAQMTLLNVPTLYSVAASAAGVRIEQAGVTVARLNLIVKLADSYFALLKAQTDKLIAQGEINRLKHVLDQSQAFLKTGSGDIIAVYEAQSRLDGAIADLAKSESTLRLAEQKLSSVVGKPVSSVVNHLPRYPTGPDPDNIDWWVSTMEKEQPAVRQAREGVAQTAAQRKAARSEYLPTLQASGGYDVNRGTAALPTAEVKQWFVGATLSLPLYSGGETSARIRKAVASEEERRRAFDETLEQQRENVKQAFFNLRYNISYIKALEQKKSSAEIQLAAIGKGRKIGTRNAIDLLNAEQSYSMALRDYKYALYDNVIRIIQLKSAAGILTEGDLSELSLSSTPILSSRLR